MSTTTTNYGLIKPDTSDPILIGQLNDNADIIDAALKENADAIENKPDASDIPSPSTAAPAMDGTGSAGTSNQYARADHVHPSDTSKQNALTTAQLAAVNSGINSTKVEQIETNKNNILYNTDNGVKNTFDFANAPQEAILYTTVSKTATSLTVTANNPNAGSSSVVYSGKDYPAGDYIFSCKITDYSCTTETAKIYISTSTAAGAGVANKTITGNGTIQIPFHWNGGKVYIKYFPNESNTVNQSNTFTASENMIMRASISDTTYKPYAMTNAELTAQWSSKQVSKWATSFSVPNPPFGQGELIKLYVYGGNPASLAMYLITSNIVVPLTSTTGISYTIQTNTSVDFTTTSTCLAYYEYIRFATS